MLYLQHDFYNAIFKIKPKLYVASGSGPRQGKILGVKLIRTDYESVWR
jgi:hypothetical protein